MSGMGRYHALFSNRAVSLLVTALVFSRVGDQFVDRSVIKIRGRLDEKRANILGRRGEQFSSRQRPLNVGD